MALVESLLTAIVRADGDALVMHVGEKPYVVASAGPIELSTQGLTLQAMAGMVGQLLPPDAQRALVEFGAVEHELPSPSQMQDDRFSVVVARGGDDVWIEVRRQRAASRQPVAPVSDVPAVTPSRQDVAESDQPVVELQQSATVYSEIEATLMDDAIPVVIDEAVGDVTPAPLPPDIEGPVAVGDEPPPTTNITREPEAATEESQPATELVVHTVLERPAPKAEPAVLRTEPLVAASYSETAQAVGHTPGFTSSTISTRDSRASFAGTPAAPAAVIPMTRTLRIEVPHSSSARQPSRSSDIERLLGIAAARHATALYLTTHASPHLRVDAEMRALEGESPLSATDIESAVVELMPESSRDAMRRGEPTEWVSDVAVIGSVRCSTFRDHRGPGAIFQLISTRPQSAEQLGLSAEIQALATEAEGLVLVAGAQGHGKSTLVAALVDVINQQLAHYVITLEREVHLVHEHSHALISQRGLRGTPEQMIAAARGALRENPDVLVIEDVASAEMFQLALEAAGSGVLVIASVTAPSTTAALTRVVELFAPDERARIQALIAERLRGAVAQVLLRKSAGGRVAAREVLLATTVVTTSLLDGQLHDLPRAFEQGRKFGLMGLTDALIGLLRSGTVDLREAYRKADDRPAFLAALKREHVDTAAIERLA